MIYRSANYKNKSTNKPVSKSCLQQVFFSNFGLFLLILNTLDNSNYAVSKIESNLIIPYHFSIRTYMTPLVLTLLLLVSSQALTCDKGGLICEQNTCHYPLYIEGCSTYATDNACAQCEFNYQLQNGLCYYSPQISAQSCCLTFDSNSICTQCSRGLQLNPASKLCEDFKIDGCLQKDRNGCKICAYNYDLVDGFCVATIQGCTGYDAQKRCISCNNTFFTLVSGFCQPVIQTKTISNCKYQNDFGCGECNPGYRIDNQGNCQVGIFGCLVHNSKGECLGCNAPYFELANGTCAVIGCLSYSQTGCQTCDSNSGFVLTNNRCQIPGCTYFNRGGCLLCANGLVAGSWGCRKPAAPVCLLCKADEYLGADSKCRKRDVHCVLYKSGVCQGCCQAFFLDADSNCRLIVPGCVYNKGVCVSCSSPFNFGNGTCTIPGCVQYAKNGCISCDSRLTLLGNVCGLLNCQQIAANYKCQQCVSGYSTDQNGNCIAVDPYCQTRNNLNICLQCKQGYQIGQNGKCVALKVGCNYVDGRCTSCRAPFIYVPATETCEIDGCLSYFVGGCQKCSTGYSLLYNSCKLPNCLTSKQGKCLECDPDFIFRSDGTCVSKDEFCDKMDQNGTCIKCMSSYYYSQKLLKCIKRSPGCKYDNLDNCIACQAPFTYEPGRCVIKGCLNFNEDGCYQCEYPFTLTKTKTCAIANCLSYSSDGHCSSCDKGFALSKEFLCESQDQYCQQYDSKRTTCVTCVKGYRLDKRGRCQYADEYCSSFDKDGICVNCDRLYFLNFVGKCQLRDPQCLVYTNGYCSTCQPYYFPKAGVCMANLIGCKQQQSYGNCLDCEDGYRHQKGNCVQQIKKLNWNSIDMDFGDDEASNCSSNPKAQSVFTVQATSTLNLVASFNTGKGKVFFSSSALNDASVLLKAGGNNGWSPLGQNAVGQFVGFQANSLQTFYACDVKQLTGSSLQTFTLEYSMDGQTYIKIGDYSLSGSTVNSIVTFYFKPVYAKYIRLVVKQGTPNIRVEFYYSSTEYKGSADENINNSSFIASTVAATIDGAENGGINTCGKEGLCWAGIESCQPRSIKGFSLIYDGKNNDRVSEVTIEYSTDGLTFVCWNNCVAVSLSNDSFSFPSPLLAQKMHVHFTKYSGNPKFGIKFSYA